MTKENWKHCPLCNAPILQCWTLAGSKVAVDVRPSVSGSLVMVAGSYDGLGIVELYHPQDHPESSPRFTPHTEMCPERKRIDDESARR